MSDQHPAPGPSYPPVDPYGSAPGGSYPPPSDPSGFPAAPGYPDPTTAYPPAASYPPAGFPPPPVSGAPAGYPGQSYPPPVSGAPAGYPGQSYAGQSYPPAYPAAPGAGYPGGPGYPGAYDYAGMPPQPKPGTNGFAIASLIFGIIGGVLFALIFGAVALSQVKKSGQKGRGLAIGGMAAAGAWVLIGVLVGIIAALADTSGDDASAFSPLPAVTSTAGGATDVQDLVKGDCLKNVTNSTDRVYDLPKVSCGLPHEGEVFATYTLPAGAFPGDDEVEDMAFKGCDSRYSSYTSEDDPAIEIYYLHPLRDTWSSDRGVTCIAVDTSGPRTGSLKD